MDDDGLRKLLALARAGDQDAFNRLMYELRPRIKKNGSVHAWLFPRVDASDVTQEAMINVWKAMTTFRGRDLPQFLLFLKVTAERAAKAEARKHGAIIRDAARDDGEAPGDLVAPGSGPFAEVASADFLECVSDCIADLPPMQRTVVELFLFRGLNYAEIGERVNRNRGAVWGHINKVLPRLRRCAGESSS